MIIKIFGIGKSTVIAIIVSTIIGFCILNLGISEEYILKLYSEIHRLLKGKIPSLPEEVDAVLKEKIIKDPKLLDYHIKREVDYALNAHLKREKEKYIINMRNEQILKEIEKFKYSDTQRMIVKDAIYYEFVDGTMGIRGEWVKPDPREISLSDE